VTGDVHEGCHAAWTSTGVADPAEQTYEREAALGPPPVRCPQIRQE
jgi:hypothetical protein